jgi:hypothetical protein
VVVVLGTFGLGWYSGRRCGRAGLRCEGGFDDLNHIFVSSKEA